MKKWRVCCIVEGSGGAGIPGFLANSAAARLLLLSGSSIAKLAEMSEKKPPSANPAAPDRTTLAGHDSMTALVILEYRWISVRRMRSSSVTPGGSGSLPGRNTGHKPGIVADMVECYVAVCAAERWSEVVWAVCDVGSGRIDTWSTRSSRSTGWCCVGNPGLESTLGWTSTNIESKWNHNLAPGRWWEGLDSQCASRDHHFSPWLKGRRSPPSFRLVCARFWSGLRLGLAMRKKAGLVKQNLILRIKRQRRRGRADASERASKPPASQQN